jgi:hypothetical protein
MPIRCQRNHHGWSSLSGEKHMVWVRSIAVLEIAYDIIIEGDIMHVDVFGQSFLIVSTLKIAEDLLEKRSSIYSDRPHFVRLPFRP